MATDWLTKSEVDTANEVRDRRCTPRLLAMLRDAGLAADLRLDVARALETIDDGRAYEPLRDIVRDRRLADAVRVTAASVLGRMTCSPWPSASDVESAWRSDDAALRRIAVANMTRQHEAILLPLLDDSAQPLHAAAIEALTGGFDHEHFVRRAIAAFGHPDAEVRRAAVEAVLFTEPSDAIAPLVALLNDPALDVARAALDTLAWYESRETLTGLAAFAQRTSVPELRERAAGVVEGMAHGFADALRHRPAGESLLRVWLDPVWRWVSPARESLPEEEPSEPIRPVERHVFGWCESVVAFRERFSELDRPWAELERELWLGDWSAVPSNARDAFGEALLEWPDATVRYHAAQAFETWRDESRLLCLLDDPSPGVAAAANYHLASVGPSARAAARVRRRFDDLPFGARKSEAFTTYAAVAEPSEWATLAARILADPDGDESLRVTAAYALRHPSMSEVVAAHLDLLAAPPRVRWDLHAALLDAARVHALAVPDLAHLRDADDLRLQEALVDYLASVERAR